MQYKQLLACAEGERCDPHNSQHPSEHLVGEWRIELFRWKGMNLLREQGRRSYEPLPGMSQATYRVADNFLLVEDEAIYGLGQHQSGALIIEGRPSTCRSGTRM